MNHRLLIMALGGAAVLACGPVCAQVTGARPTPRQLNLVGNGDNSIAVNWRVSTATGQVADVTSSLARFVDPASGAELGSFRGPLRASGTGPLLLRELVQVDQATVQSWIGRGLSRVVLERTFFDSATGSSVNAAVVLSLSRSRLQAARDAAPAELSIVSLRLELGSGNNAAVAAVGEPLRAILTVQYAGSGMLRGRWQIAEPESAEGVPLFRTVALVNTHLQAGQRSTLRSPALPTARGGKYLVRFCVSDRDDAGPTGDLQCPDVDLTVAATYHVQGRGGEPLGLIGNIAPDRQTVSQTSAFSWQPLADAAIYQLQVFELAPVQTENGSLEPKFVTGMLLHAQTHNTPLSELVRSKLRPGQRYLWRVTAHDEAGRMIGSSAEASFIYQPEER